MAEVNARHSADTEAESGLDEFFKSILASKALKPDEKREIEVIARESAQQHSLLAELQSMAAQQARKVYRCKVCGLEFVGILNFKDHNESTAHMRDLDDGW